MARSARVDVGDCVYHVINRAVGRLKIFEKASDYNLFLNLVTKAKELTNMRILAFVAMPNHWHFELYPRKDKDLGLFMHWLTNAHTRQVHSLTNTIGTGPLYQGRYKSFLIEDDRHLLMVLKYIERNPVRANIAKRAEEWRWGSAWIRQHGTPEQRCLLAESPTAIPRDYLRWINTPDTENDLMTLRSSVNKGTPFGRALWVGRMVNTYKLQTTVRQVGRPTKKEK